MHDFVSSLFKQSPFHRYPPLHTTGFAGPLHGRGACPVRIGDYSTR